MNCNEFREKIAYDPFVLKDASESAEAMEMLKHINECEECKQFLEDMLVTEEMLNNIEEVELPEDAHEKAMVALVSDIENRTVHTKHKKRRVPVFTLMGAAAAVVILALSGNLGTITNYNNVVTSADDSEVAEASIEGRTSEDTGSGNSQNPLIMPGDAAQGPAMFSNPVQQDTETSDAATADSSSSLEQTMTAEEVAKQFSDTTEVLNIPDNILNESYAYYIVAAGTGEISNINGTSLYKDDKIEYYSIKNDLTIMETTLDTLKTEGYSSVASKDARVKIDSESESGLIVVIK